MVRATHVSGRVAWAWPFRRFCNGTQAPAPAPAGGSGGGTSAAASARCSTPQRTAPHRLPTRRVVATTSPPPQPDCLSLIHPVGGVARQIVAGGHRLFHPRQLSCAASPWPSRFCSSCSVLYCSVWLGPVRLTNHDASNSAGLIRTSHRGYGLLLTQQICRVVFGGS